MKTRRVLYGPDATVTGAWSGDPAVYRLTIDGREYTTDEARDIGFVPARTDVWTDEWVQANGFQVRGILKRGDAQKFSAGELCEVVRRWLADRGVEFLSPDMPEAFCFNYHVGVDLDVAREQASKEPQP